MKFVVLGSTGMLGSEVARVAKERGLDCIEVSRHEGTRFDITLQSFHELAITLDLSATDYVVNCIGWIPQKSLGDPSSDEILAHTLNEQLPNQIDECAKTLGFRWVQIATDCVFSGATGGYVESSPKDASDLYGLTKIAGENCSSSAMQIRSSVVGPDNRTNSGLYSWFLSQVNSSKVATGYRNHLWNGVSTTAFARLAVGLALAGVRGPFAAHWLPIGVVTKLELLRLFAANLGHSPDSVVEGVGLGDVDRTLSTLEPSKNLQLWRIAGYEEIPTIEELVAEFISHDQNRGLDEQHPN
jgi:dTDP-4-dehydrorhamnose reductase